MMKVLHAAAECFPLVKTGGLADVLGALPAAQRRQGVDARIVIPGYRGVYRGLRDAKTVGQLKVRQHDFGVIEGSFGSAAQPIYLLDCPQLFDRPGDPYRDETGREFWDNGERFATFGEAVARLALSYAPFQPDVVHLHDWQPALAAAWMHEAPARPRLVFSVHNLAYQGLFGREMFDATGLPARFWSAEALEFWGGMSFMKAGLSLCDAITTVSPTYAKEIQTVAFGCALDGVLRHRAGVLHGIVNGIDESVWNPATDPLIAARYAPDSVAEGKRRNKAALQAELGLSPGDLPLAAFIGRLAAQKGAELIPPAASALGGPPLQFVVLAGGESGLERVFRDWAARAPAGSIAVKIAQDEVLAHRITAAADLLVMPSRYEPCGLNQMYAQRYGTLPVVHRTGGLADTVVDADPVTLRAGTATGVQFEDADVGGVIYGLRRALALHADPVIRRQLQETGMGQDFGWSSSARAYLELYGGLLERSSP